MAENARSSSYPAVSLKEAREALVRIYTLHKSSEGKFNRDQVAAVLEKKESTIHQLVASLCYYGWLDRKGNQYSLSPLGKISATCKDDELIEVYREGFLTCKLFRMLYKHTLLRKCGAMSSDIKVLMRQFGITTAAAMDKAWRAYTQSCSECNLLDEYDKISPVLFPDIKDFQDILPYEEDGVSELNHPGRIYLKVKLDGGEAVVSLPRIISPADIYKIDQTFDLARDQLGVYMEKDDDSIVVAVEDYLSLQSEIFDKANLSTPV